MTEDEFWGHIAASRPDPLDPDAQVDRLTARLAKLPPDDILDFQAHWDRAAARAERWDLWGAAYLIRGGCSDDGFHYFRCWLLLQGREAYEAAVADPDTLADMAGPRPMAEAGGVAGAYAWLAATGTAPDGGHEAFYEALDARHPGPWPSPPLGDDWDHDDAAEMRRRFPRLAAIYLGDDPED
ncbi:MAG: DUF4240 domain-containing protein [Gemmataceae bacterium]|nr:DUF4240 domain-containing protein [Gemmataceae bacterium]